jgi:hypothetical protein
MSTKIDYVGVVNTKINNNGTNFNENIQVLGDYDGIKANIDINHALNGLSNHYQMQLTNDDIRNLLLVQPVVKPLEKRLVEDFNVPVSLEGIFKKSRRHHYKNKISKKRMQQKMKKRSIMKTRKTRNI